MSNSTSSKLAKAKAAAIKLVLKSLTSFSAMRHSPSRARPVVDRRFKLLLSLRNISESNYLNIELDSWNGENIFDIEKQSQNHLDGYTNHPQEQ